jgi:hypothetical protein
MDAELILAGPTPACSTNRYLAYDNVAWTSSNPSGATVDEHGLVTAHVGAGSVNIGAERGDATGGPHPITLTDAVKVETWCEPGELELGGGDRGRLRALVRYSDDSVLVEPLSQYGWNRSIVLPPGGRIEFGPYDIRGTFTALRTGHAEVGPWVDQGAIPVSSRCLITIR